MTLLRPIGQPMTHQQIHPSVQVECFEVRGTDLFAIVNGGIYKVTPTQKLQAVALRWKPVNPEFWIDWELAGLYADHVMHTPAYQAWIAEQREIDRHRPDPYAFLTEQDNCLSISDRH